MINSVLKAIDVLCLFSPATPRLALTEISRRLGLPKSTVHSLLATLMARGLVEKMDDDSYALGPELISLTQSVRVNVEIRDRAAPLLRELANKTRESIYLTILDGTRCLYIYAVETHHRLLARSAVGEHAPLYCTAVGKAMLAYLPQDQVEQIIAATEFVQFTPNTITDSAALCAELAQIVERGYATDRSEHEQGVYCVGAPIFNHRREVVAACSVSGASPGLLEEALDQTAHLVRFTAQEISRRMGYVPASPAMVVPTPADNDLST
ncbi:MAG: IclR family transcriptional regulator [Caldilineaceae bacterium]|nr:IclR family transcriptional regulator [Caldilineaceae bacterium]